MNALCKLVTLGVVVVVATITHVVSADGKSLTHTFKGTNAQGQAVTNVTVYEKQ